MRTRSVSRGGRRRGALYILATAVSLVVAAIGLSTLATLRLQNRAASATGDRLQAELWARSGVEWARLWIQDDSNWRTNRPHGTWISKTFANGGEVVVSVVDPADGDLADDPMDSVQIVAQGIYGAARQKLGVSLYATVEPIDVLRAALHAAGGFEVQSGKTVAVEGAPLSSNGTINNSGTITGNVECAFYTGTGTVAGTVTPGAPSKPNPDPSVMSQLQAAATAIPYQSTMQRFVLSSGVNPWGSPNPNGVYVLNTGGADVVLKQFRVQGTLVIQCGADRTVTIDEAALVEPHSPDYPAIVTDGSIELKLKSDSTQLSESAEGTNFNPPGAPYNGVSDSDQNDVYPNEIRGLVHVKGTVNFSERTKVVGAVVTERTTTPFIWSKSPIQVTYDPILASNPPLGYRKYQMKVQANSWKRLVD